MAPRLSRPGDGTWGAGGLINAVHTNETMRADFSSIKVVATDNAFYLFHDVINWNMISGFNEMGPMRSIRIAMGKDCYGRQIKVDGERVQKN
jgi:hypothetical protein